MKKSLKRLLSVMMVVVLAMGLVACGSSDKDAANKTVEKLTVEQLMEKMANNSTESTGVKASGTVDFALKMSAEGIEQKMTMDGKMEVQASADMKDSHIKVEFGYEMGDESDDMSMEAYSVLGDDVIEVYSNDGDEWTYEEQELDDYSGITEELQSMMTDFDFSAIEEYCTDITVNVKKGNYELVATIDSDTIMDLVDEVGADTSSLGLDLSSIPDFKIVLTAVVDSETFLPKSMSIVGEMDKMEMQGVTIELSKCAIEMKFDSYGDVKIEVPEDALAAKED